MTRRRMVAAVIAIVVVASIAGVAVGAFRNVGPGDGARPLSAPLSGAPWLVQPTGSPSLSHVAIRDSVQFPAGVSYARALSELYVSALGAGDIPADAKLVAPLPRGIVLERPADPRTGITVSLVAPWGYAEDGAILAPWVEFPSDVSSDEALARMARADQEGRVLPEGAIVAVPALRPCQISIGTPGPSAGCALADGDGAP